MRERDRRQRSAKVRECRREGLQSGQGKRGQKRLCKEAGGRGGVSVMTRVGAAGIDSRSE